MIKKLMEMFKQDAHDDMMKKLEAESQARAKRNEERIAKIKEEMGTLWVLHPSHKKEKLDAPRPV